MQRDRSLAALARSELKVHTIRPCACAIHAGGRLCGEGALELVTQDHELMSFSAQIRLTGTYLATQRCPASPQLLSTD